MYKKQVFDINLGFDFDKLKEFIPVLEGYETQITPIGFRLRNANKFGRIFNEFKPDIEIKYILHEKKMTLISNSLHKYFSWLIVGWIVLMIILMSMVVLLEDGSFIFKFWFGVIIGAWFVIPSSMIVSYVIFRKKTEKLFDKIYSQFLNINNTGDGSMC